VFCSNVVTLANDIKAVNRFVAAGNNVNAIAANTTTTQMFDMDYIMYVFAFVFSILTALLS
jgi:hypothetical protein